MLTTEDEDANWDRDIDFSPGFLDKYSPKFMASRGIFACDPDKELANAFARISSPLYDDDDNETESTFVSNHSDKLYADERNQLVFPGLDDYMMDIKGVVTRLGTHKRFKDDGDWDQDIQFPAKFQPRRVRFVDQTNNSTLLDDEEETTQPPPPLPSACREMEDEEEDNFFDIEFPQDMSTLQLFEKQPKQQQQQRSNKKHKGEEREEDFFKDLKIESDDVFRKPPTKRKSLIPRRRQPPPAPASAPAPPPQPASLPSRHPRVHGFKADTYASRQRQVRPVKPRQQQRQQQQRQQQPCHATDKTGPSGATLIAKPRSMRVYGNGTELDNLDILPEWKKRRPPAPKVDPQRPWRHNMTRRKPTLIRPDEQPVQREYNNMRYDSVKCRWQGNEKSVLSFDSKPQTTPTTTTRRPALITNMQRNGTSKYAELVIGTMVFDPSQMRWKKTRGSEEDDDDNALAEIEDLRDSPLPSTSSMVYQHHRVTQRHDICREFDLSPHIQRHIHEEEQTHNEQMKSWSLLSEDEPMVKGWAGMPVRPESYLAYE